MSKFVKWISIAIGIVIVSSVIGLLAVRNYDHYPVRGYIAHAGGSINGDSYTNSLEAVENSIANGFKFIELDLGLTSDSVLVAIHHWEMFREQCGAEPSEAPMSYEEFKNQRILGKYHPISAYTIDSIFMAHPDLVLVTDKIDDADILTHWFGNFKDRIITECFSDEAYNEIKKAGIFPLRSYKTIFDLRSSGKNYVINKTTYDYIRHTYSYKIATKLLNSRIHVYILADPSNKAMAESMMADDPYIDLVYIDEF